MRIKILHIVLSCTLAGIAAQADAVCDQIAPNPNPAGSTIANTSADGCNELDPFDNYGILNNTGAQIGDTVVPATLNNTGTLNNYGELNNTGVMDGNTGRLSSLNNNGVLVNEGVIYNSRPGTQGSGRLTNNGTLINNGTVSSIFGIVENHGTFDNYGLLQKAHAAVQNTGVLNNYSVVQTEVLENSGVFNNNAGATAEISILGRNEASGTLNNDGTLTLGSSRNFVNRGVLKNNLGATFSSRTHQLINEGTLINDGTLISEGGGPALIVNSGEFLNSGTLTGTTTYAQTTGSTVVDGSITQAAVNINGGLLSGSGTITSTVTVDGGTLAVGNSPGMMTIHGDYTQTEASTFEAEIGGLLQGIEYDFLSVSGTAFLDGLLDIVLYDLGDGLFAPDQGDYFDILSAETISGTFSNISYAPLGENLRWEISYLVDAYDTRDVVRLAVAPVPEPEIYAMMAVGMGIMGWAARRKKLTQAAA